MSRYHHADSRHILHLCSPALPGCLCFTPPLRVEAVLPCDDGQLHKQREQELRDSMGLNSAMEVDSMAASLALKMMAPGSEEGEIGSSPASSMPHMVAAPERLRGGGGGGHSSSGGDGQLSAPTLSGRVDAGLSARSSLRRAGVALAGSGGGGGGGGQREVGEQRLSLRGGEFLSVTRMCVMRECLGSGEHVAE
jgi:hypothetical protein